MIIHSCTIEPNSMISCLMYGFGDSVVIGNDEFLREGIDYYLTDGYLTIYNYNDYILNIVCENGYEIDIIKSLSTTEICNWIIEDEFLFRFIHIYMHTEFNNEQLEKFILVDDLRKL